MRAPTWLAAVALGVGFVAGFSTNRAVAERKAAQLAAQLDQQTARAIEAARAAERRQADALASVAVQYEKDKTHAQAIADRTIADLRAGHLRLRAVWRCSASAAVPAIVTAAGQPDAATDDRDASASRIVRAATDADAQIRGLQAILTAEREGQ